MAKKEMQATRMVRESATVLAMIRIFCHGSHDTRGSGLCPLCNQLRDYVQVRMDRCPFRGDKPTCVKCPVHCFKPEMRERVRQVMRYAGPRMPIRHPYLTLMHFLDGRRKARLP